MDLLKQIHPSIVDPAEAKAILGPIILDVTRLVQEHDHAIQTVATTLLDEDLVDAQSLVDLIERANTSPSRLPTWVREIS